MSQEQLRSQSEWLSAIGEPTRLAIIRNLAVGTPIVTELATTLKLKVANISQHLKILRRARVVAVDSDGRFMRYRLIGTTATANEIVMKHDSGITIVLPTTI